ncbi:hypothetical protein N7495_001743 [Penicillium taxi]|uniref:uncharacterized protein n=1 Tax=Penicillium taxi TaxID=168475 RepID=UPI00254554B8|nr:uncharacterized protein N7495_001743 [Penicillium taxi]KAJ5909061.1 hypothetical protein N7495_001743 [Penicillium taxi]
MEVNFAPRDAGQDTGIRGCRKDLARYRDTRLTPDQLFRSPKTTVRGVGAYPLTIADLHSLVRPTGVEFDQLRYQRRLQRGPRGRDGASTTSGSIASDSAAAIYINGGAGRGLRV